MVAGGRSPERVEADRILALRSQFMPDAEDVEIESYRRLNVDAFQAGERLRPLQVWALREWEQVGGGMYMMNVGSGKSGTALMVAQDDLSARRARKVMLLMPVQLVGGFLRRHVLEWARRTNLPAPFHNFRGRNRHGRMNLARTGAPGIYVMPYSLMSQQDTIEVLQALDPDTVLADEAHYLKRKRSGCTRKLLHYLAERRKSGRPVRCGFMSGSFTSRGILDYHHLAVEALGDGVPLPRSESSAYVWSLVLDAGAAPPAGLAGSALGPLARWAGEDGHDVAAYRRAYRRRLTTAPGVVASSDDRPTASLLIQNRRPPSPGPALLELVRRVEVDGDTPQGDPIDHAIHRYKWFHELWAGVYNSLVWPTPEDLARGRRVSLPEAQSLLTRAREHHRAEQDYHRELREFFKDAPANLAMPTEVASNIARYGSRDVGAVLADLWRRKHALEFPGKPERLQVPVRVDDFKVRDAVEWMRELPMDGELGCGGVVFAYHHEVAEWAVEAGRAAGLDVLYCPAGADREIEAVGDPKQGGRGDRIVVASMRSHGLGRNLQAFCRCLFLQWPRAADLAEQALGRFHREGQAADTVEATTSLWSEWDDLNRGATLNDAMYVSQTIGAEPRVLYADYNPLPDVYPVDFLASRGMSPDGLDAAGQRKLREKFGK